MINILIILFTFVELTSKQIDFEDLCAKNLWLSMCENCIEIDDQNLIKSKNDFIQKDYIFIKGKTNSFYLCRSFVNYLVENPPCNDFWRDYDFFKINELKNEFHVDFLQRIRKEEIYKMLVEIFINEKNKTNVNLIDLLDSLKENLSDIENDILKYKNHDSIHFNDSEKIYIPKDLNEAINEIDILFGDYYRIAYKDKTLTEFTSNEHLGLGYQIRLFWGLSKFSRLFWFFNKKGIIDSSDNMSNIILKAYYLNKIKSENIDLNSLIIESVDAYNSMIKRYLESEYE